MFRPGQMYFYCESGLETEKACPNIVWVPLGSVEEEDQAARDQGWYINWDDCKNHVLCPAHHPGPK